MLDKITMIWHDLMVIKRNPKTGSQPPAEAPAKVEIDAGGIAELKAFLLEMVQRGDGAEAIDLVIDLIACLRDDNNAKAIRIAKLLRERFGRKGEKVDREQLDLFLQSVDADDKVAEDAGNELPELPAAPEPTPRERKRTGRNPLPAHLPRRDNVIAVPDEQRPCPNCGGERHAIGYECSELLELVPAHFFVRVDKREKLACRACEEGVSVADPADKPIDKGRPGPGLLTDVAVSKYADHQPLYRIAQRYGRLGVDIAPSTLMSWIAAVASMLEPLHKEITRRVLCAYMLGIDDTHIKVLDRSKDGNVKRGHLWPIVGYVDGRRDLVSYHYSPDWKGEHPQALLASRTGFVQADAYKGINKLFQGADSKVTRVGCFAHVRRKYKEALDSGDLRAAVALKLIGRLYEVERRAGDLGLDVAARQLLREEYARPALVDLKAWAAKLHPRVRPTSPLGKALGYTINQWLTLEVYVTDGAIPIDNNGVENEIRPIGVGRRNWLFAGSDAGGERAAVIYTMLGCCRLHRVDPAAWLCDVLEKLSGDWKASRLEELLPSHWQPAHVANDAAA